jgi:hypothetical protein
MGQRAFKFTQPSNFKRSDNRAVGFLEEPGNAEVDAKSEYEALERKASMDLKNRIDWWVEGNNVPKKYFHGFDMQEYRECFVFKRAEERFYGFKCHPRPVSSKRFQLCVLIYHDSKYEEDANYTLLDRVNVLRKNRDVTEAISAVYSEYRG